MVKQQPEALRLAESMELYPVLFGRDAEAAAELRRLHAMNQEMLKALQACHEAMSYMSECDIPIDLPIKVKVAIAKATGESQ